VDVTRKEEERKRGAWMEGIGMQWMDREEWKRNRKMSVPLRNRHKRKKNRNECKEGIIVGWNANIYRLKGMKIIV
jgi:hypothetical protein